MSAVRTPNATWHATGKIACPWHKKRRHNNNITNMPRAPRANSPIPHARAIARPRARGEKTPCLKKKGFACGACGIEDKALKTQAKKRHGQFGLPVASPVAPVAWMGIQ